MIHPRGPDRPRDRAGRPLARDADPGLAAPPAPDVTGRTDEQVWRTAVALLDDGLPFNAHEVFEQRWRRSAADERTAWQAMAQWGAACTHAARGNAEGAHRLARRALTTLDEAPRVPAVIDVERVRRSCARLLAERAGG